jgi:hypothetical protein
MPSQQSPTNTPSTRVPLTTANLALHNAQQAAAVRVKRRTYNNNYTSMMGIYIRKNEAEHSLERFDDKNFSNAAEHIAHDNLPFVPRNAVRRADSVTYIDAGQLPAANGNVPANLVHHVPVQYMSHWDRVKNGLRRAVGCLRP